VLELIAIFHVTSSQLVEEAGVEPEMKSLTSEILRPLSLPPQPNWQDYHTQKTCPWASLFLVNDFGIFPSDLKIIYSIAE